LKPVSPWYFLIKRDTEEIEYYNKWWKVTDIFPVNSVGIVTARDEFAIDYKKENLEAKIRQFRDLKFDKEFLTAAYNVRNSGTWNLDLARIELANDEEYDKHYYNILYRPFDTRFIYYSVNIIERMRYDVMQHMLKDNLSLCFMRQYSGQDPYSHALVSEYMVDNRTFFSSKGIIQQAPLYLYPTKKPKKKSINLMLFEAKEEYSDKKRKANISEEVLQQLTKAYKKIPIPEEILGYVYAILYSNVYREKFAEFLKIDFPRIPFTKNYTLFQQLAELGNEIIELHLLKHKDLNYPKSKYTGRPGNDKIEKPVYNESEQAVYINDDKYFTNITPETWKYQIGGYQVLEKYLKDRKGRQMEDPAHYCKVAASISKTIELQILADKLFLKVEKSIIAF